MITSIALPKEKIAAFCRRNYIHKLAWFGSALRDALRADSDLDVLVEFDARYIPGLAFFAMERELSQILGRKVDLNTRQFLSPDSRKDVPREAMVLYEQR